MGEEPDLTEVPPATLRILVRNQDAGGIIGKVGEGSTEQSSNPIGQFIIHIYICIHAVAPTTP